MACTLRCHMNSVETRFAIAVRLIVQSESKFNHATQYRRRGLAAYWLGSSVLKQSITEAPIPPASFDPAYVPATLFQPAPSGPQPPDRGRAFPHLGDAL